MGDELARPVDLEVDLNTMDETALSWAFLDEQRRPDENVERRRMAGPRPGQLITASSEGGAGP